MIHSDAACRLAAYGLPGGPTEFTDPPARLLDAALHHRLTGILTDAVAAGAVVHLDDEHAALIAERHADALHACVRLEVVLWAVLDAFGEAGLDALVLKGPALAHGVYREPGRRTFGDVDVLVRPEHWDAARDLLLARGATAAYSEPRPGFTARFGKGVCLRLKNGLEVDLHRTFVAGAYGLVFDPAVLFDAASTVPVDGRALPALGRAHQTIHAAVHAVLGGRVPSLVPLRDLAELTLDPATDAREVRETAVSMRLDAVLARAVATLHTHLGIDGPLTEWARTHRGRRFDERAIGAYTSARRTYASQAVSGVRALPTWRDRVAYTSALLAPQRSYLDAREGSYARRALRGAKLRAAGERGKRAS